MRHIAAGSAYAPSLRARHTASEVPAGHAKRDDFDHHFGLDAREQPIAQAGIATFKILRGQLVQRSTCVLGNNRCCALTAQAVIWRVVYCQFESDLRVMFEMARDQGTLLRTTEQSVNRKVKPQRRDMGEPVGILCCDP